MTRPVTWRANKFTWKDCVLAEFTDRDGDGLYGITLSRVKFKNTVNFFLLKECWKRFGRLGTAVDFESDPRFPLSIEDVEKVLCCLSRNRNGGMTGIGRELRARRWCRTRSGRGSPVMRWGRRVHEGKESEEVGLGSLSSTLLNCVCFIVRMLNEDKEVSRKGCSLAVYYHDKNKNETLHSLGSLIPKRLSFHCGSSSKNWHLYCSSYELAYSPSLSPKCNHSKQKTMTGIYIAWCTHVRSVGITRVCM